MKQIGTDKSDSNRYDNLKNRYRKIIINRYGNTACKLGMTGTGKGGVGIGTSNIWTAHSRV